MVGLLKHLARVAPHVRSSTDPADCVSYARDLWPRHHLAVRSGRIPGPERRPAGIVWPESTRDVATIVRAARETHTALVPFGAGSGVCGGVLPNSQNVIVDMKRMRAWRQLSASAHNATLESDDGPRRIATGDAITLTVEAGELGIDLERALEQRGLTLGHFPSSIVCSTVGGWIAARSAGQCSSLYGKIEDMVVNLECVTGAGDIVTLHHRDHGPNLVPLVVGSEGTLAIVTAATLRLHSAPSSRAFGSFTFPSTQAAWNAMRAVFQAGLRPAVCRVYDPFDAMLARRGSVKKGGIDSPHAPGLGAAALRTLLRKPAAFNALIDSRIASRILGGALAIVIFDGHGEAPAKWMHDAKKICIDLGGRDDGPEQARHWMAHRYSVSYRQAPVFEAGLFADTMEVAAPWSRLDDVFSRVRHALGEHVFVMAHLSHAYEDGCCIYFSFAGSASNAPNQASGTWDERCEATYDAAWRAALDAALRAGATISHHHGVGRSKAPRMLDELSPGGAATVRALMRAFDPSGILNPGNLIGDVDAASDDRSQSTSHHGVAVLHESNPVEPHETRTQKDTLVLGSLECSPYDSATPSAITLDVTSHLVHVAAETTTLLALEAELNHHGFTLALCNFNTTPRSVDVQAPCESTSIVFDPGSTVAEWLAQGAPGAPSMFEDPADHLVAGIEASLPSGVVLRLRPSPRRAVGPDLVALFVAARGTFGRIHSVWLRMHPRNNPRRETFAIPEQVAHATEPNAEEVRLLEAIKMQLAST